MLPVGISSLVPGGFSNKKIGRGRSKEKKQRKNGLVQGRVDITRIDSDNPDDIFDLHARYHQVSSVPAKEDVRDDERQLVDSDAFQESREAVEEAPKSRNERTGTSSRKQSFNPEEYLINIVEKLQIKEVLEGLQSGSMNAIAGEQEVTKKQEQKLKNSEAALKKLQKQLEMEIQNSSKLQEELNEFSRKYQSTTEEKDTKIMALEDELLRAHEANSDQLAHDSQSKGSDGFHDKSSDLLVQTLKEEVSILRSKVSELVDNQSKLEADLASKEGSLQSLTSSTNQKIIAMEQLTSQQQKRIDAKQVRCNKLELELETSKGLLELEKEKTRVLEASESRAQKLVETERQRCETLSSVNERMQATMNKLNKEVKDNQSSKRVKGLKKELDIRGSRIGLIHQILSKEVMDSRRNSPEKPRKLRKHTQSMEEKHWAV